MGTRGAWGMIKNGEEKVTYNHYDSYPTSLGKCVIDFVDKFNSTLSEIYDRIELVNSDDVDPTVEQWEHCKEFGSIRMGVGYVDELDWYKALREAQSDGIDLYGKGLKYMINSKKFLLDSLFCEFAYIINLDTNVLEVYRGFNHDSEAAGRYAYCHNAHANIRNSDYFGVVLKGEIPLQVIGSCKVVEEEHDDYVTKITYDGGEVIF